jgi:hypothetical protein
MNLTNDELRLKAAGVNFAIFTVSDLISKELQKNVKEMNSLKQEDINKVFFVVSYVSLFEAQKFFWENFIQDEKSANTFEAHLFRMFAKTSGVDPKPHIKDFVDYVKQIGPSGEIQYIGSKICKLLEKRDAFLNLEISTVFASFLTHGFLDSMKKAWELPNDTLKEMADKIDSDLDQEVVSENSSKENMKKYIITAQSLVGDDAKREIYVEAENEKLAKEIAFNRMFKNESERLMLDNPGHMLTADEIDLKPQKITDLLDNMEAYIDEMRKTEDVETIPKELKQYAWEYFREVEISKEDLQRLAIFVADKTYRVVSYIEVMDNYTRAFFAKVIPYLWDSLQDRGVDTFYILDNELREDRFRAVVLLFELTGMAVVTPYGENDNLEYEAVEKQIKDYMAPVRNIMYVEKNASVNYLDKVKKLAKESRYLCIFRSKAPTNSNVEVFNSKMQQ